MSEEQIVCRAKPKYWVSQSFAASVDNLFLSGKSLGLSFILCSLQSETFSFALSQPQILRDTDMPVMLLLRFVFP